MALRWKYGTHEPTCGEHGRHNETPQKGFEYCFWPAHLDETLIGNKAEGQLVSLQLRRTVEDTFAAFALTDSMSRELAKRGHAVRPCARTEVEGGSTAGFRWESDSTVVELHWVFYEYHWTIVNVVAVLKPSSVSGLGCPQGR
ncbi:MAG: hypothetical protein JWO05_759 [Gemmatimonadetes bacterium]|nr:hypothetical protein [Gemmatimonadota bacterium]